MNIKDKYFYNSLKLDTRKSNCKCKNYSCQEHFENFQEYWHFVGSLLFGGPFKKPFNITTMITPVIFTVLFLVYQDVTQSKFYFTVKHIIS